MKKTTHISIFILLQSMLIFLWIPADAQELKADAVSERMSVFAGEPFIFQIQVSGSENPEQPDMTPVTSFSVEFQGGRQDNSSSISIINGHMTRSTKQGYVFSYQLVPRKTGRLSIPAIAVHAEGKTIWTSPLTITVQKPAETDSFKLRLFLSKVHCYVGEPVILTVKWYIGQDVRGYNFTMPLLEKKDAFDFIDPEVDTTTGEKFYRIPLGDGEVFGKKGQDRLSGKEYATITFKKILIPKKPGIIHIAPTTVACETLVGYRQSQRRSPFGNDFFNDNFFGAGRKGVYQKAVVPSNSLDLEVKDVPKEGRPVNFAGHVGEYRINARATPTKISVGDPITLKLSLSGPDYLDHVTLPPLTGQLALTNSFKIPRERAVGETQEKQKIFTQTIRALRPGIKKIPPIELPYFDTQTGKYEIARTAPIPITVKETRVITALDAEGASAPTTAGSEVETWTKGIAYNYDDMSVIKNQHVGMKTLITSPVWFCMVVLPPVVYILLLSGTAIVRKKHADPLATRAKKAYAGLSADLKKAAHETSEQKSGDIILDALRNYLGAKLRITHGAIVFNDVKKALAEKGVALESLDNLRNIFDRCEAGRYAGASDVPDMATMAEQTLSIGKTMEKVLK